MTPLCRRLLIVVSAAVLLLAGCGSEKARDSKKAVTTTTTEAAKPKVAAGTPLRVLVTNDDGVGSEGIDAVVTALKSLQDVEVLVFAPRDQQSGQGGKFTEGAVATEDTTTRGGQPAVAVVGYPADAVRVALDERKVQVDLVVSGINEGQNLGPVIDISGTIGAARAGVKRGIPALALSAGVGEKMDYSVGATLMTDWIAKHRDLIVAKAAPVQVTSINIPTCTAGAMRGLVEVPLATGGNPLAPQNCTSNEASPPDDITAMTNGFATLTVLPNDPKVPYQPGTKTG